MFDVDCPCEAGPAEASCGVESGRGLQGRLRQSAARFVLTFPKG